VGAELAGEALRQPDQAELRGALRGHVRVAAHAVDRRDVDDAAAAPLGHAGERGAAERRRGGQVRRDDPIPFRGGELEERPPDEHAGVVDEHVERTELRLRPGDALLRGAGPRDVLGDRQRGAAELADLSRGLRDLIQVRDTTAT
jgi:hypothetical protein